MSINNQEKNLENSKSDINTSNYIKNLVISGGGFRGFSLIGVLRALEKFNLIETIDTFVGTSIGAIFAFLISIRYTHTELYDFVTCFTYESLADLQILNCLENYGLETGNKIINLLRKMLKRKCKIEEMTFKEHYDLYQVKLCMNAVCVNTMTNTIFSVDSHPDLSIFTAIRASIAIPLLLTPVIIDEKLYVDGGLLENFLIRNYPSETTLGIKLSEEQVIDTDLKTFESYVIQIIKGIHKKISNVQIDLKHYHIINIMTDCSPININLTKEDRIKLYKLGYVTAKKVLLECFPRKNLFEELLGN